MQSGIIFDIKRFAIHDGPGIRTTVFLKGCPLTCAWCHNPEGRSPEPEPWKRSLESDLIEIVGREVSSEWLLDELTKDRVFFEETNGGVTFSGGEPLLQAKFLIELLEGCRRLGLHTAVDTTGHADPQVMQELSGLVDLFLFDLKLAGQQEHELHTGIGNDWILANLRWLSRAQKQLVIRIPLVPGITYTDQNIAALIDLLGQLEHIAEVQLLPYHTMGNARYVRLGLPVPLPGISPPSPAELAETKQLFAARGYNVNLGGHA